MTLLLISLALSLLIILFGGAQGRNCFGAYRRTMAELHRLVEAIKACGGERAFKEVVQEWRSHSDLLVDDLAHALAGVMNREPLQTERRSGWVLDVEEVCDGKRFFQAHAGFGRLEAMPGILTGAGILFTFLGLVVGLSGLDPTNADRLTSDVQRLLGGMSLAFLTSIAGIATALWWTWRQKEIGWRFESCFNELRSALRDKPFLLSSNDLNLRFFRLQESTTRVAKNLEEVVYRAMTRALEASAFAGQGSAKQTEDPEILKALAESLPAIRDALDRMSARESEHGEFQRILNQYLEKLNAERQQFAHEQRVDIQNQLQLSRETAQALERIAQVEDLQREAVAAITDAGTEMKKLLQAARLANADILHTHKELVRQLQRLDRHWEGYREQLEFMKDALGKSLANFKGELTQSLETVHAEFDELLARSLTHFSETLKGLDRSIEGLNHLLSNERSPAKAKKGSWLGRRKP